MTLAVMPQTVKTPNNQNTVHCTARRFRGALKPLNRWVLAGFIGLSSSTTLAAEPATPPVSLGQAVYQVLLGEIALRRGDPQLAFGAWQDLARKSQDPLALKRAIEIGIANRQWELCLPLARTWRTAEPNSTEAKQTLNTLLMLTDRLDELMPQLAEAFANDPERRADGFLQLNRSLAKPGNQEIAWQLVQRLAAPYPNLAEAHYAVGTAAERAGHSQAALLALQQARALRPEWAAPWVMESQVRLRDTPQEAVDLMRQFVRSHAQDPAAPFYKDSWQHLGRLLINTQQYVEARAVFQQLSEHFPTDPELRYPVAILSLQLNDADTAEATLNKLLEQPLADKSPLHFFLGQIAEHRLLFDEAIRHYQQVSTSEHGLNSQLRIARIQRQQGLDAQALETLEYVLNKHPDHADVLYETALLAEKLGHIARTEKHLRHLIKLKPDHAMALNALGYSLADHGMKLDEAYLLIKKALELQPQDPFILDSLGWVLYRQGKLEAALKTLSEAYQIKPDAEIAAHLGEVLWQRHHRDQAIATWQRGIKTAPDNSVLNKTIRRFLPHGIPLTPLATPE